MTLPIVRLAHGEYKLSDGQTMRIRGLSRAEALQLQGLGADVKAVETLCIQAVTGVTEEEAQAWIADTPNQDVEGLVNAIAQLSGLDGKEGKADAEGSHSANMTELITSLQKVLDALSQKSEPSPAPK